MSNANLVQFSNLDVEHFSEQLDALLKSNLEKIGIILTNKNTFTWENLISPLEDMESTLKRFWSPLSHMHAVVNSPALRECYQACLPKLSAYGTAIGHNQALYNAIKSLDKQKLDAAQCKIVDDAIRDFELSGVALSVEKKQRFEAIQLRLSELENQFENNILDAGAAFNLQIHDQERLHGLPEHTIREASELAKEKGLSGWAFNLEFPCYFAVMSYADDRTLRQEMHYAYMTRASDLGPFAGQFDNSKLIDEILALRHEKAQLLGFSNFAELSLATKMAKSTTEVIDFLHQLATRARDQAQNEYQQLQQFAKEKAQLDELAPWDITYLAEKQRQSRYAISQEELRPYFPLPNVMTGLFSIVNKLYGMQINEVKDVDVWHPEVKCYCISDEQEQIRGYIYVDLFARQHKRDGAWMDSCADRYKHSDGSIQYPVATLTCNFTKPTGPVTATLSHDEVLTLFHEFGHCLQHVLTRVDYCSASGINGVEWDAVELPSQFFENWCWESGAVALLAEHVETGEPLPIELFNKLIAAKNFQSAMTMMRQIELSLFDFRIHQEFLAHQPGLVADILADVRQQVSVVPVARYNRFQQSFSHIFCGGYAAGYYSYKWAEVLSSDAFGRFEEEGIFNPKTGRDFLHCILEQGGAVSALEAYVQFRGRPATIDALLRHNEIQ